MDSPRAILKLPSRTGRVTKLSQNRVECTLREANVRGCGSTFQGPLFASENQLPYYLPNQRSGAVVNQGTYVISRTLPIRMNRNGRVAQMMVPIGFLNR